MARAIVKATPADAGCYVDGHWGQYGIAHMVDRATEFGFEDVGLEDIAGRHLACIGPSTAEPITDDEHQALSDAAGDVEQWLNDNVAPEGHSFGWYEGEFYLWPDAQWEDPFG